MSANYCYIVLDPDYLLGFFPGRIFWSKNLDENTAVNHVFLI